MKKLIKYLKNLKSPKCNYDCVHCKYATKYYKDNKFIGLKCKLK